MNRKALSHVARLTSLFLIACAIMAHAQIKEGVGPVDQELRSWIIGNYSALMISENAAMRQTKFTFTVEIHHGDGDSIVAVVTNDRAKIISNSPVEFQGDGAVVIDMGTQGETKRMVYRRNGKELVAKADGFFQGYPRRYINVLTKTK